MHPMLVNVFINGLLSKTSMDCLLNRGEKNKIESKDSNYSNDE